MEYLIIIFIIILVLTLLYFTKEGFGVNVANEEYELIKKYLLNESPLYGKNKPKIWIHTVYEVNGRDWKSFHDRASRDLNQPYIDLTVQTIIDQCASNFNVLLINDETFSKLIPHWKWDDLSGIADPQKTHIRQRGLLQLLYYYGGMIVPNSFICFRNLEPLFDTIPFVVETVNRTLANDGKTFSPSLDFMGVRNKRDASIRQFIDDCYPGDIPTEADMRYPGDTANKRDWEMVGGENDVVGKSRQLVAKYVKGGSWSVWSGELFGVKTMGEGHVVRIEDLMEEDYLDLSPDMYGILVDSAELLRRPKYEWLAYIKAGEDGTLAGVNNILAKYLNKAVIDGLVDSRGKQKNVNMI